MPSASAAFNLTLVAALMTLSSAFAPSMRSDHGATHSVLHAKNGTGKRWDLDEASNQPETAPFNINGFKIPNPFNELADMFSNFDDVVDDFFNKRMGNGEVFYGKRKYKPSGKFSSDYNGGGLSDWRKIEAAREFREERAMMREMKEEQKIKAGSKDM
mmetsp:Transcript_33564/g.71562  ORF Transcript_33564/g.71562 Transcript_33564/m.71562 type:complete len:158 (-) Transcript_33564:172-645(-)